MATYLPRRSLSIDFAKDGQASGDNYPDELSKLDSLIAFSRASTATRFNASGVLESVAAGQPRFDYDPSTLSARGLLIEEARTNLLTYSSDLTQSVWTKLVSGTGSTPVVSAGFTGPGGQPACRIQANRGAGTGSSDYSLVTQNLTGLSNPHTSAASIWVKSNTGSAQQVYAWGQDGFTATIINVTTTWQRFVFSATWAATTDSIMIGSRGGASPSAQSIDILVSMAQLEIGAGATSNILTTTAQITRSADSAAITTLAPWFNLSAGTLLIESATQTSGSVTAIAAAFSDNSTSNRHLVYHNNGSLYGETVVGGVSQAALGATGGTAGVARKLAYSYSANAFSAAIDGAAAITDSSGSLPASITRLDLGGDHAGANRLNGWIKRIAYQPYKVSDLLLKQLATV